MNTHVVAPAIPFPWSSGDSMSIDHEKQQGGILQRWKNFVFWSKVPDNSEEKWSKELWKAVVFAVGIILGYSWGATESLVRSGKMFIYDIAERIGPSKNIISLRPELVRANHRIIALEQEKKILWHN